MKKTILLVILLTASTGFAMNKHYTYKHWKTFKSNWSYEFKYPDCWVVRVDNSDESQTLTPSTRSIFITETSKCKRPQMAADVPNGISMDGWSRAMPPAELKKYFQSMDKKDAPNALLRGDWRFYKHAKVGGHDEVIYVEDMRDVRFYEYRWNLDLYCGQRKFYFQGPTIKNAGPAYERKFKSGDNALPEPERTIYASIRCINPKKMK